MEICNNSERQLPETNALITLPIHENTGESLGDLQPGTVIEAAKTLVTMHNAQHPESYSFVNIVRRPLTEKINIIENVKLN